MGNEHNENDIIQGWLKEIKENPQFSDDTLLSNTNLETYSKTFLGKLIETTQTKDISGISKETFEPVLDLWHQLLKDQMQQGFSTKDTAVLVYALKTSLMKKRESLDNPENEAQMLQVEQLLDLLGILIFEMYTAEKERLITRQNEHIQYLQSNTQLDDKLISNSPTMNQVFKAIGLILENDITILLEGESGTGKDLIANIIHNNSKRKSKPFVAINCGAIPKDLIESELFGHEKGAFTGAEDRRIGKFELADEGTLFLDEIGEMPTDLQVKLLRAIQNKEIERVGGTTPIPIKTRIIAATNKNLKQLVDENKFRLDLYYRLNTYPIQIPPLRDRKEDIIPLANFFIDKYNTQFNLTSGPLTADAEHYLLNQTWEGNIRELENTIQRAIILAQNSPLNSTILDLKPGEDEPILLESPKPETPLLGHSILPLEELEKQAIEHAIKLKKGNLQQVAKSLGISRTTLYNKIEKYGLEN